MAATGYKFDRLVKATFTVSKPDENGDLKPYKTVTINFDPLTDRELCSRIDFWIQGKGCEVEGLSDFFKTARIDLYNVGPALNGVLSVYETIYNSVWNVGTDKIFVKLEVGHRNQGLSTIFSGSVGSYNVERVQTESTVDNIWHIYCMSNFTTPIQKVSQEKAISVDSFLEPGFTTYNIDTIDITGDQAIRNAFKHDFRYIMVEEDGGFFQKTVAPNDQNIDDLLSIKYVIANSDVVDRELENNFKKNKNYTEQDISNDLVVAVKEIAKKLGNYTADVLNPQEPGDKWQIRIYKQSLSSAADIKRGRNWKIKNFENLVKAPSVSGGSIQLSMLMEPSMRTFDTIELQVDSTFDKTASFEFNFNNNVKSVNTVFAGSNVMGLAEAAGMTEQIKDAENRGNIFYKQYCVTYVEHQGSTHTNEWITNAFCTCAVTNSGEIGGV